MIFAIDEVFAAHPITAGHDFTVLSVQLLEHFRDLTLAKVCRDPAVFKSATESEIAQLRAQAAKADSVSLSQMFDRFSRVVDRLPTSRVQRMLLEMGLLELAHREAMVPLTDIIERLDALSQGVPTGGASGGGGVPGADSSSSTTRGQTRRSGATSHRRMHSTSEGAGTMESTAALTVEPDPPSPSASAEPTGGAAGPEPVVPSAAPSAAPGEPNPSHGFGDSELMKGLWDLAKVAVRKDPPPPQRPPHEPPPVSASTGTSPNPAAHRPEGSQSAIRCGPCSEAPPNPNAIDLELTPAFEAWETLVGRIREREEFVSAVLSQVGLISFSDGRLTVCAKKGSFPHIELTASANIRSSLEQAARDHLGKPFTLELVDEDPSLDGHPSIVLVNGYRKEKRQREVEAEARDHGAIQNVLSTFNATLMGTKPLEG